jgi:choline dehydrogenase
MSAVFDYVIVGAGSAGCVLANRLSKDPSTRVLLVEAGRSDRDLMLHVPGLSIRNSTTPRFNWSFMTEEVETLEGRKLFWAQGKAIGGSSAVNGMIYARGNPKEYDAWRDAGCAGWGFEDLLPFFKKSEGSDRGESRWHGADGPLKVSRGRPTLEIADRVLEAAVQDGFEIREDFNTGEQEGFGHYDCTIDRGRRCSSATAFLHPVRKRPNLTVAADTLALRILFDGDRATGLELMTARRSHTVRAECEVILCCGAINSPQLLMLSGIGPAAHLKEHGIAVRLDQPSVGANLQNHVSYRLQYGVSEPITAFRYVNLKGATKAGLDYILRRGGVLADSVVPSGGFFRTEPGLDVSDVQVQVGVGLMGRPGKSVLQRLPKEHGFSLGINQGRPYSRGEVRLRSASPEDHPMIMPRYFSDERDLDTLVRGIERMISLAARPALARLISKQLGNPNGTSRASIVASIRERAGTAFHPVGTCRMGADEEAVVDPLLRVRGVRGLRVADASAIPLLMNANTNAAAIMIGERAAELVLAG